jgi:integrase
MGRYVLRVRNILVHPSGRKSYRRRYPGHLQAHLSSTHFKVSLGFHVTPNAADDPDFMERYTDAQRQFAAIIAAAERAHAGTYDKLDAPMIAYLGKLFETEWLRGEDEKRREGREGWAMRVEAGWEWHLDDFRRWYAEGDVEAAEEHWGKAARKLVSAQGLVVDPFDDAQWSRLCMELNEAALRVSEVSLARLSGKVIQSPEVPARPCEAKGKAGSPVHLLATFDAYTTAQGVSPGVREEWRRYIQHLVDFLGDDDARKITREDVVNWRDHLLVTPNRLGKQRLPVTVKDKYIMSLKCTLGWAVEEKKLAVNVASDVKVRVPRRPITRRGHFTMDEARMILRATLEKPKGKLSAPYARARRWIPWLCAYSGARVNEISQLRKEDIQKVDGVWLINITPEAGTVKSGEARQVPLHAHLIEQGFLGMVESQRDGPLFYDPSKVRVKGKGNRHFKKVGERLGVWVRKDVGVIDPGIKPNHAWRHLFKTLAASAGIQEKDADAIQGHAPSTAGRGYGEVPLDARANAIALFPRFDVQLESAAT